MNEPTTDQPSDHVVDHRPTSDQPSGSAGADQLLTLEEAAAALDISVNAVRQRIKRHTIAAVKTDQGWLVDLVATNQRPAMSRPTNQPTDHVVGQTDPRPTTDLAPLAEVIEKQNQRNEEQAQRIAELSAALGMWQARAHHLEDQLQQLTATAGEATESPEIVGTSIRRLTSIRAPSGAFWRVWRDDKWGRP